LVASITAQPPVRIVAEGDASTGWHVAVIEASLTVVS
jgi:hypothetical protein